MPEFRNEKSRLDELCSGTRLTGHSAAGKDEVEAALSLRTVFEEIKNSGPSGTSLLVNKLNDSMTAGQHRDLIAIGETLTEISTWLLENAPQHWSSAVRYLEHVRDLRAEVSIGTGRYDRDAVAAQMRIVACYEAYASEPDHYQRYSEAISRAIKLLDIEVSVCATDEARVYRCFSTAAWLTNVMSRCFEDTKSAIHDTMTTMRRWVPELDGAAAVELDPALILSSCDGYRAAFLLAALSNYQSAANGAEPDIGALLQARQSIETCYQELSNSFNSLPEGQEPVGIDCLGVEKPLRRLMGYDALNSLIRASELQLATGDLSLFVSSWRSVTDRSQFFDDQEFLRLITVFDGLNNTLAERGEFRLAVLLNTEMAHCCRNRIHQNIAAASEFYLRAAHHAVFAETPGLVLHTLIEGVHYLRRVPPRLDDFEFASAGRLLIAAFRKLREAGEGAALGAESATQEFISNSSSEGAEGWEPTPIYAHPLVVDPSPVILQALRLCDACDRTHESFVRLQVYLEYADYLYERDLEQQAQTYVKLAHDFIASEAHSFTRESGPFLVDAHLQLGKLLLRDDQNSSGAIREVFEQGYSLVGEHKEALRFQAAELLYHIAALFHRDDEYGAALSRLRLANHLLRPDQEIDERQLTLEVWTLLAELEEEHGDQGRAWDLKGRIEQARLDWEESD